MVFGHRVWSLEFLGWRVFSLQGTFGVFFVYIYIYRIVVGVECIQARRIEWIVKPENNWKRNW